MLDLEGITFRRFGAEQRIVQLGVEVRLCGRIPAVRAFGVAAHFDLTSVLSFPLLEIERYAIPTDSAVNQFIFHGISSSTPARRSCLASFRLARVNRPLMVPEHAVRHSHHGTVVLSAQRPETLDVTGSGGFNQFRLRFYERSPNWVRDTLFPLHCRDSGGK